MSAYTGPQGRGRAKIRKKEKRAEAEARNKLTPPERRRIARTPEGRLLLNIFADNQGE